MPDSWLYFGRLLLALIGQRELKTVGATDGDTLDVDSTCDYLFGVFMSHTLHTAGNMADVGMLFSFLFHFVVGFTNSITLAVLGDALRACMYTCVRWVWASLERVCSLSRKRTSARMCASERRLRQIYLEKKVSLVSGKNSVFYSFHRKAGVRGYRGI